MLSSGNWGGKVEQRHCQLLEKKNATFEASNKEIEIASCTVEEQLKIKKIIENTSKRFKRKEVFLYGKYLFCRSSYRNWCWKENIVNNKIGLLKNKNKDQRVTKFSNIENEF